MKAHCEACQNSAGGQCWLASALMVNLPGAICIVLITEGIFARVSAFTFEHQLYNKDRKVNQNRDPEQ